MDDRDVARPLRQLLEERPQRRDADPRAHEEDLAPGPDPAVQDEATPEPRSGASGAMERGSDQSHARAAHGHAGAGSLPDPAQDARGARKPERVTVPAGELELRPTR